MKRLHWIVLTGAMALFAGLSAARAESETKSEIKVADKFKVSWSTIAYTKRVSLRNTEVSEDQSQEVSESLSLSCEVEILDPNFVLGISRAPVIEEMTDDKGVNIEIDSKPASSFQTRYEAPRYDRRFVAPQNQAKWKTAIRSALRLSQKESSRPQWVEVIRPSRMQIDLGIGMGGQASGEISRVKGYFYALIAESYEYVDVPFKKSDKWVRLTSDVEIQVRDAWCKDSSYRLSTKSRPEGGVSMRPLTAESYMPTRLVMSRQLVGPDDKPVRRHAGSSFLPYHVGGNSSGGGSNMGQITKIRYVIAVNPTHYEIPFVLEHIPLPKP